MKNHNVKAWWQPLPVRCTTPSVYEYMLSVLIWLCMCLFGRCGEYACILSETSKPDEKNTTTWKHDGNLYLCGARLHLFINICFLHINGYVCVCLVDLGNMHVFYSETSKPDEKNTTTWKHDGNLHLCGARLHLSINTCFLYLYGYVCVYLVDLVNMHVSYVETSKPMKRTPQREAWWQPLPVRCTIPFVYKYMLSVHIWLCMCLFGRSGEYACILCRNIAARWKTTTWKHDGNLLPVWCTTPSVYKYMLSVLIWLCMCPFGRCGEYACVLSETSKPDEKNTTTWKHDGNLYLCGARLHLFINICFLHINGYVCFCLVDLVNMHVFYLETSKPDEKNTTTWKHDGNLYLCGARLLLCINTCFLYVYGYVSVCLVDLVNMHVFYGETSKPDEKNTTTSKHDGNLYLCGGRFGLRVFWADRCQQGVWRTSGSSTNDTAVGSQCGEVEIIVRSENTCWRPQPISYHMRTLLWNESHAKLASSSEQGPEAETNNEPTHIGTCALSLRCCQATIQTC